MKFNYLKFKRITLVNDNKSCIDFIIDDVSLNQYLGGNDSAITPYGWGYNKEYELSRANHLIKFKKSSFDNGLQSAYVCPCCGDEGCGAIMFDVINHGYYVEWNSFVYSDGSPTESEPDDIIQISPFYFEIGHYQKAIGQLKSLIKNTKNQSH